MVAAHRPGHHRPDRQGTPSMPPIRHRVPRYEDQGRYLTVTGGQPKTSTDLRCPGSDSLTVQFPADSARGWESADQIWTSCPRRLRFAQAAKQSGNCLRSREPPPRVET